MSEVAEMNSVSRRQVEELRAALETFMKTREEANELIAARIMEIERNNDRLTLLFYNTHSATRGALEALREGDVDNARKLLAQLVEDTAPIAEGGSA